MSIVISGAYGMDNLGDEAIFDTLLLDILALNPSAQVTVLVYNEDRFVASHREILSDKKFKVYKFCLEKRDLVSVRKVLSYLSGLVAIMTSDLFIWGGGGLIRDNLEWLSRFTKPLLFAQSVRRRIFICCIGANRITHPDLIKIVSRIHPPAFLSVRDEESKRNLLSVARRIRPDGVTVISDPAFHIRDYVEIHRHPRHPERRIGLNATYWKAKFGNPVDVEKFTFAIANSLNIVYNHIPYSLIYMPTVPEKDAQILDPIKKYLNPEIPIHYPDLSTPKSYLKQLGQLDLFIGMRLHSLLLASNVEDLQILGIIYDDKVGVLARRFGGRLWTMESVVSSSPAFADIAWKMMVGSSSVDPNAAASYYYPDSQKIRQQLEKFVI